MSKREPQRPRTLTGTVCSDRIISCMHTSARSLIVALALGSLLAWLAAFGQTPGETPTDAVTWAFRILFTVLVAVIVPVYLVKYGAVNFLWFSDIGLLGIFAALWLENQLLGSMMALAVLLPERFGSCLS